MKRLAQSVVAVAFGALIVTASVIGGVMVTNPTANTLDEASDSIVQRGDGQAIVVAGAVVAVAAMGYETWQHHQNEVQTEDLADADAYETKLNLYDQASIQKQNKQLLDTAYSNYLNDTQTIALMEGKNAYIRALENGSTKTVAKSAANEAIREYYAVKQRNILAEMNTTQTVYESLENTSNQDSNIADSYVSITDARRGNGQVQELGTAMRNVTLVDRSTEKAPAIGYNISMYGENGWYESYATLDAPTATSISEHYEFTAIPTEAAVSTERLNEGQVDSEYVFFFGESSDQEVIPVGQEIEGYDTNVETLRLHEYGEYYDRWTKIEQQSADAVAQVDTFINGTYDSYQQGDINASDLVDPYLGAREYSPENATQFQDWSLRTLTAMGLNSPQNLSNVGRMTVVSGSVSYDGILMSDGTPSGGFTVGQTYNASTLQGLQFVALDGGGAEELSGEFTLESAETADGTTIQENESITYQNITYETANTSEFQALQDELDALNAEINARQQELRNAGGGGLLPDFGFGGVGAPIGLIAAGAVVFLLGRN